MLPAPISRWLRLDLPAKIAASGVAVTTVTPGTAPREVLLKAS